MIHIISEEPLKYADEEGNEVEILTHICSLHGNEIKYVIDKDAKIPVFIPSEESGCSVWKEEL